MLLFSSFHARSSAAHRFHVRISTLILHRARSMGLWTLSEDPKPLVSLVPTSILLVPVLSPARSCLAVVACRLELASLGLLPHRACRLERASLGLLAEGRCLLDADLLL